MFDQRDRRLKRLAVSEEQILNCFVINGTTPGAVVAKLNLKGVPPGTMILGSYYCDSHLRRYLFLYNSQWPIVPEWAIIPEIKFEVEPIQVRMDLPRASLETQPLTQEPGIFRAIREKTSMHGDVTYSYFDEVDEKSLYEKKMTTSRDWREKP